jgi:hypothetical protein
MTKKLTIYAVFFAIFTACSHSYGEPKYELIKSDPPFEIRYYKGYLEASVTVDSSFDDASRKAFPILFDYISGKNLSQQEIDMTAPVTQESEGVKIKMTAPVTQESDGDTYRVAFVMPSNWNLETLPKPTDSRVKIHEKAASKVAVINYSGTWSVSNYNKHLLQLQNWLKKEKLVPLFSPVWARYNSPFSLWFMRRNEIQIEVK